MKNKKILVTGATGFIGSYLIRSLIQKGYRVRGLKRPSSRFDLLQGAEAEVEWMDADVTDIIGLEDAFEGITHVCHCAASISFHPRDVREMHRTNVTGTANVVNLCVDNKIEKLVHISSIAALGRSKERLDLDEKCQWIDGKGNSNYAITKHLAEQEVWRGVAEGLNAVIVSPSVVVGSRSWDKGMAAFFKKLDQGLKVCPSGQSGFVDVRDVVVFIELMLGKEPEAERYILNAVNLSHRDFFGMIAKALNVSAPVITAGPFLVDLAWRLEWLKEKLLGAAPMVTRESAAASITKFRYHNEKSLSVPGFHYTPFEKTISDVAGQYLLAKKEGFKTKVLDLEGY